MNFGLDEVAKNLEDELCNYCRAVTMNRDTYGYECPADLTPGAKDCARHKAHERIFKLLMDVDAELNEVLDSANEDFTVQLVECLQTALEYLQKPTPQAQINVLFQIARPLLRKIKEDKTNG